MELLLILLVPGITFIIPRIIFRFIVKETRDKSSLFQDDFFLDCKKRAQGFKIVTFVLLCIPTTYIIVSSAIKPPHSDGLLWSAIFLLISLGLVLNGIQAFKMYNYLFFVDSNKDAALILLVPFIPCLLLCIIAIFAGATVLAIPVPALLLLMEVILYRMRH